MNFLADETVFIDASSPGETYCLEFLGLWCIVVDPRFINSYETTWNSFGLRSNMIFEYILICIIIIAELIIIIGIVVVIISIIDFS